MRNLVAMALLGGVLGCGPGTIVDVYMSWDEGGHHQTDCFRNEYKLNLNVEAAVHHEGAIVAFEFRTLQGERIILDPQGGGDFDEYGISKPSPGAVILTLEVDPMDSPFPDGEYRFDIYMTEAPVTSDDEVKGSTTFRIGGGCPCFPFEDCRDTGLVPPGQTAATGTGGAGPGGAGGMSTGDGGAGGMSTGDGGAGGMGGN